MVHIPRLMLSNIHSNRTHASKHLPSTKCCKRHLPSPWRVAKFSTRDARRTWIPMQWSHAPRIGERGHPRGFQDSGEQRRSPNFKLGFPSFLSCGAPLLTFHQISSKSRRPMASYNRCPSHRQSNIKGMRLA